MTYNLLNYRNSTTFCAFSQNNPITKEGFLKTITDHVNPDILVCNEIGGGSATNGDFILTNVLNTGSINYWDKAAYSNNGFSNLVNMLYYNTNKLALVGQDFISKDENNDNLVRVIDVYRLYYKDPLLTGQSDTVFFTVLAAHFKAGTTASDLTDRNLASKAAMDYILTKAKDDNIIFAGDLNIYKSQEAAYQTITQNSNQSIRLYDPLNAPGNWSNNGTFASLHTQSTRSGQTNGGCFSGGGLDDRLDHILISKEIRDNEDDMRYINNTYWAVGNDGMHFNDAINDGPNNSVPSTVLDALYGLSDHLPVVAEFEVKMQSLQTHTYQLDQNDINLVQTQDNIEISVQKNRAEQPACRVYDITGRIVFQSNMQKQGNTWVAETNTAPWSGGFYLIEISTATGNRAVTKLHKP